MTETWNSGEKGQVYKADFFLEQEKQNFLVTEILEIEVIAGKKKIKPKPTSLNILDVCHSVIVVKQLWQ